MANIGAKVRRQNRSNIVYGMIAASPNGEVEYEKCLKVALNGFGITSNAIMAYIRDLEMQGKIEKVVTLRVKRETPITP